MKLNQILSAELQFERNEIEAIEGLVASAQDGQTRGVYKILLAAHKQNFSELQEIAREILETTKNSVVFTFVLQFALAGSEVIYDMDLRNRLLLSWNKVPTDGSQNTEYTTYMRLYSQALSAFFTGHLVEADHLFSVSLDIATEMNYPRGQMRALFHLGLVARDRGIMDRAGSCFFQAKQIAIDLNAHRFLPRFNMGQSSIEAYWLETDLQTLLKAKDWRKARSTYLKLERKRKKEGKSRYASSYYVYSAVLAAAFGKIKSYQIILSHTADLVVKEKIISLKANLLGASDEEITERNLIRLSLGYGPVVIRSVDSVSSELEIAGILVSTIENEDVKNLLKFLAHQPDFTASKENICEILWNLSYDPSIHDGKIYKLIHKCRQLTRLPDLIVNMYGSYRLKANLFSTHRAS